MRKKKFLSLTNTNLISYSTEELLEMIDADILDASNLSLDYAYSVSLSILKKLFLFRNKDFNKFYKIITSKSFRGNRYIYRALSKDDYFSLRDLFNLYKDEDLGSLLDYIFIDNKYLFNEMIIDGNYNLKDIFSYDMMNHFRNSSYRNLLGYLLKGRDKKRVIKALLNKKNNKYIYIVSKMDDMVLSRVEDDKDYFDAVITLLKYSDYRHLIWNYYDRFIKNSRNEAILNSTVYDKFETVELKELLHYTFTLMNVIYSSDRVPEIIYDIDNLIKSGNDSKDMVHRAIFGVEGYKKFRDGTFDVMLDFPKVEHEVELINLKVAFFSTIYGLTYSQVEQLVANFLEDDEFKIIESEENIYDTMIAIRALYGLTLEDKEEIDLYRSVYYKYVKKNGVHATIEIEAMTIVENLMRRMYNNSIEMI